MLEHLDAFAKNNVRLIRRVDNSLFAAVVLYYLTDFVGSVLAQSKDQGEVVVAGLMAIITTIVGIGVNRMTVDMERNRPLGP